MSPQAPDVASLKRTLGLFTSTMLVTGLMIGSGVFKKIVPMAQSGLDEGAILMAWFAAGVITLFGAFTLSGFASLTEESGGTYEYFRLSYGNFFAFLSGWGSFTIIDAGACAALGFLFGQTINTLIPLSDPLQHWEHVSIANFIFPFADSGVKLAGLAAIVVVAVVNYLGVREGSVFNNVLTILKVGGILILIFLGLTYSAPESTVYEATAGAPEGVAYYSAFLSAMLAAFWAYNGWDVAMNISGEIVDPKRNVPLALTFGCLLLVALYVLVNFAYMQVLPPEALRTVGENEIGAFVVARTLLGDYGQLMLLILFLVSVFGALNSNMVTVPRRYFRMAQEGFFFKSAKQVHPKFRSPHVALIYTMFASCVLLISGTFELLTNMVIFTSYLFFGLLTWALFRMKINGRITAPVVGYPIVPGIFLAFTIALSVNTIWMEPKQSLLGTLLILSGVPFYFYFKSQKKRSGG